MGTEARLGLLLGATACLLAVMVDWVVEELTASAVPEPLPGRAPVPDAMPTPDATPTPV